MNNPPVPVLDKVYKFANTPSTDGWPRFEIEWNSKDDSVWYDILAFSRPRQMLARFGYPYVRHMQKQFARESTQAMKLAVDEAICQR